MSNLDTELLNAAKNGDIKKIKRLISKGADVNAVDMMDGLLYIGLFCIAVK